MLSHLTTSKPKSFTNVKKCWIHLVSSSLGISSIPPVGACPCGTDRERKSRQTRKIGSQALQTQNPVTYRETKTLLRLPLPPRSSPSPVQRRLEASKENGGYQAYLDPIWRQERAQQTNIFHLHTGQCGLRAYLKRAGISDTFLCECK